ncbi:MAG: carboxylating nicotinate-nucleotide diphosphorylase [Pirellulales bacterium]|nr:carboxylating nicotinate-nucleotide diphosphorylase [Pirellulales bacterium]
MPREFPQIAWDDRLTADCRAMIRLALAEDLGAGDWTTEALVPESVRCQAAVTARQETVVAGLPAVALTLDAVDPQIQWRPEVQDGDLVACGARVGVVTGPARGILVAERTLLNFLGRLSGIADLTRQYVAAVAGTAARIYDTRKTTPGWRRLEKYAVRCGGGWNHREGLFAAVLIKDNHLAWGREEGPLPPAEAVRRAKAFLQRRAAGQSSEMIVEIEVDTLEQLADVLPEGPDIILLDNMPPAQLRQAAALRTRLNPNVELEASGGVDLTTVRAIAETGVERISVGALTHSPPAADFGLDEIPQKSPLPPGEG